MDLRPRFLMWVDVLMFFVGFGLVFAVAFAWANQNAEAPTWEDRLSASPPAARDRSLTAAVATALKLDPELGGYPLQVTTANGVVQLSGRAPSADLRERAARLAAQTPGVARVDNRVRVDPATKRLPVGPEDHRAAVP